MRKIGFLVSLTICMYFLGCDAMLTAATFNPGDYYIIRRSDVYLVNDTDPSDNSLFISGLTYGGNHQITFSYKDGYVDHMFVTTGTYNNMIREYNADGELLNSWSVGGTVTTGICDLKANIVNGTTTELYLVYKTSSGVSNLSRLDIASGTFSSIYTTPSSASFSAVAVTIPQIGQTGTSLLLSEDYDEEIYEIDIQTGSILQTFDLNLIGDTNGIDFGRNADGTTSNYFYALEDANGNQQVQQYDLLTGAWVDGTSTSSNNLGYATDVAVKPNENGETEDITVLQCHSYEFLQRLMSFTADGLDNNGAYQDTIFQYGSDSAYVHYGWDGLGQAIPEPATILAFGLLTSLYGVFRSRKK